LARLLKRVYSDLPLRVKVASEAVRAATEHTGDRIAAATWEFLSAALVQKGQRQTR